MGKQHDERHQDATPEHLGQGPVLLRDMPPASLPSQAPRLLQEDPRAVRLPQEEQGSDLDDEVESRRRPKDPAPSRVYGHVRPQNRREHRPQKREQPVDGLALAALLLAPAVGQDAVAYLPVESAHRLLFVQVMTNVQPGARSRPRRSGSETQASAPLSGQTRTPG